MAAAIFTHLEHGLGPGVNDALAGFLHLVKETHGCDKILVVSTWTFEI